MCLSPARPASACCQHSIVTLQQQLYVSRRISVSVSPNPCDDLQTYGPTYLASEIELVLVTAKMAK